MLILSRKVNQRIFIGEDIVLEVINVEDGGRVKIGISAPDDVTILREELIRPEDKGRFRCSNGS